MFPNVLAHKHMCAQRERNEQLYAGDQGDCLDRPITIKDDNRVLADTFGLLDTPAAALAAEGDAEHA
jgi:hypothetical protein